MTIFVWILIIIVALIILFLSLALVIVIKKATYLSKKEKEIIDFSIDMYIDYGEEIEITSEDQHLIIIDNLKKIKEKLNDI